jgi:cytidylate kinase
VLRAMTLAKVVAIDGPSGAGKSTVARRLAGRLAFAYLDTGAMYRAVTWYLLERCVLPEDPAAVAASIRDLELDVVPGGPIRVGGRDVTAHLRSREVESRVSAVSAVPEVRAFLVGLQRSLAARGPLVAEGRDMTTVVFPDAQWKFFLDADPRERARRRSAENTERGTPLAEADVLEEITVRDRLDSTRKDAPLRRDQGAVYIDTTSLDLDTVVERMAREVERSR